MASDTRASVLQRVAEGLWHPPRSSEAIKAEIWVQGDSVIVRRAGAAAGEPALALGFLSTIEVSSRVGNVPRRIAFSNGSLLETPDNDGIDRLLQQRGSNRAGALVHGLERFHPRLIALVVAVFLLATMVYRFALPALVEVAVLVTPDVVPQAMSAGTLKSLDATMLKPSQLPEEKRRAIEAGFSELARKADRGTSGYSLNFREGGVIGPNAFALPSGTIILTDELVDVAGNDTDMVLAVLAHEIGHVDRKHSLRQIYRAAGTAGLIMLIAGDVGSAMQDVLTNGAALLSLSYSREAESEADHYSVLLMTKAGKDPLALARFFTALQEKLPVGGEETSMFDTHPGMPDRQKMIEQWAREAKEAKPETK